MSQQFNTSPMTPLSELGWMVHLKRTDCYLFELSDDILRIENVTYQPSPQSGDVVWLVWTIDLKKLLSFLAFYIGIQK